MPIWSISVQALNTQASLDEETAARKLREADLATILQVSYIVMASDMAYMDVAYMDMACIDMACRDMAYIDMAIWIWPR